MQQRFRESLANCNDEERVQQHKWKHAASQRNYMKAKKQCVENNTFIAWQSLDEFIEDSVSHEDIG